MKDNDKVVPEPNEESFCRKLAKNATMSFTRGAALAVGLYGTLAILSAVSRRYASDPETTTNESTETEIEQVS